MWKKQCREKHDALFMYQSATHAEFSKLKVAEYAPQVRCAVLCLSKVLVVKEKGEEEETQHKEGMEG